jgi:hypothetical protein
MTQGLVVQLKFDIGENFLVLKNGSFLIDGMKSRSPRSSCQEKAQLPGVCRLVPGKVAFFLAVEYMNCFPA